VYFFNNKFILRNDCGQYCIQLSLLNGAVAIVFRQGVMCVYKRFYSDL